MPMFQKGLERTKERGSSLGTIKFDSLMALNLKWEHERTGGTVIDHELKRSLFAQFFQRQESFSLASLRANHGGSHSILNVKYRSNELKEGAAGGPGVNRDFWERITQELMSKSTGMFHPVKNNACDAQEAFNRDQWVPNPNPNNKESEPIVSVHLEAFTFVGQLIGVALRNKMLLNLNLATIVWKALANDRPTLHDLRAVDYDTFKTTKQLRDGVKNGDSLMNEMKWTVKTLDGRSVELIPNGKSTIVSKAKVLEYCDCLEQFRLNEYNAPLKALRQGLSMIIPAQLLSVLTWQQIEKLVTGGSGKLDLKLLKSQTKYSGFKKGGAEMTWFWEIMEELDASMHASFLRFVWGRTKLPLTAAGFTDRFKIEMGSGEERIPTAMTCFFTLTMSRYSSKQVMRKKLIVAIENGTSFAFG
jgi:E3 ubiquitin-protein ligase HERC2